MAQDIARVSNAGRGLTNGADSLLWVDGSGALVVMDFLTKAILDGHGYQVRLGVLTTPVVGDVEITTVAAEMAANSAAGLVIMPCHFTFDMEAITGTLVQATVKMQALAATGGTAFTPLPLLTGGRAASTTALANDAGGVAVEDDAAATTRVLYMSHQAAMGNFDVNIDLLGKGIVNGLGAVYSAVGTVTTGSSYFSELSYLEYTTGALGL